MPGSGQVNKKQKRASCKKLFERSTNMTLLAIDFFNYNSTSPIIKLYHKAKHSLIFKNITFFLLEFLVTLFLLF